MRKQLTGPMPTWIKTLILLGGIALLLPGIPIAIGTVCASLLLLRSYGNDATTGTVLWTLTMLTFVAGAIVAWHASRSISGKPSRPLRLPPAWWMAGGLFLALIAGMMLLMGSIGQGILFPIALLVAAAIPPLLAITWFRGQESDGLSWRRGLVAFAASATIVTAIVLVLEQLVPLAVFSISPWWTQLQSDIFDLQWGLEKGGILIALTERQFVMLFLQLVILAPLVETFLVPLVTLPLIGRLSRRDAFLVAAMAGAGFTAVENVVYGSMIFNIWLVMMLLRGIGAAIHPLTAGLVGLGWRDLLNDEQDALRNGLNRFGFAIGIHAIYNGSLLLFLLFAGTEYNLIFFHGNPLDLPFAGIMFGLLIVVGAGALWLGRMTLANVESPVPFAGLQPNLQFMHSNRAAALVAIACLVVVVPASVTALGWILR